VKEVLGRFDEALAAEVDEIEKRGRDRSRTRKSASATIVV
jgi:hypothetical protein